MAVPLDAPEGARPLRIAFSGTPHRAIEDVHPFWVNVPCLAGLSHEEIFPPARAAGERNGLRLFESGDLLLGAAATRSSGADLEARTGALYAGMLAACEGRYLYRVWNYVPRINQDVAGLEQYRAFCRGRSLAFEAAWGGHYKQSLPSASAVGCDDDQLTLVFAAGRQKPRHVENPEQVPAYEYPQEHGPRAPSFSRATVATAEGQAYVFISGTAAIKGHATVAPGALEEQVACTIDNLRLISRASGTGDDLGTAAGWLRHFKVYLRHAADLEQARRLLEQSLLRPNDRVSWLRADVCRAALNIEIETTLVRGA